MNLYVTESNWRVAAVSNWSKEARRFPVESESGQGFQVIEFNEFQQDSDKNGALPPRLIRKRFCKIDGTEVLLNEGGNYWLRSDGGLRTYKEV